MFTADIIIEIASSLPDTLPYNPAKQRIADRAAIISRTTLHVPHFNPAVMEKKF